MRAARVGIAATVLCVAALARAQDDDGQACETTSDCGDLRCIDGRCRDVQAMLRGDVSRAEGFRTDGEKALFGDGHGYVGAVVAGDVIAAATVPLFFLVAAATGGAGWAVAAALPTTFTGPLVHIASGRPLAGAISFLGWASVPPCAVGLGYLAGVSATAGPFGNAEAAIWTFVGVALSGAVFMTTVDAFLARRVEAGRQGARWVPSIVPVRGGGLATLGLVGW